MLFQVAAPPTADFVDLNDSDDAPVFIDPHYQIRRKRALEGYIYRIPDEEMPSLRMWGMFGKMTCEKLCRLSRFLFFFCLSARSMFCACKPISSYE